MKLLYFGTLEWGCTSLQRAESLRRLNPDFYGVDLRRLLPEYTERSWAVRASVRLGSPRLVRKHRDLLLREVRKARPDCLWVDQGLLLSATALKEIRQAGVRLLVHYTPDAIRAPGMGRVIHRALPAYDLCITTKKADLEEYRRLGAQRVLFNYQGFDPAVHRPLLPPAPGAEEHAADLVFVGQCMSERQQLLSELAAALPQYDLRVYGRGWEDAGRSDLKRAVRNRWLRGDDYAMALANARIGLCFLNTEVADQYTTRTFEIPACGSFMLAQHSSAHQELFAAGKEADFFGDGPELIEKVGYWLEHEDERARAAAAGHRKVVEKDWTWSGRMRECLAEIERLLAAGATPA